MLASVEQLPTSRGQADGAGAEPSRPALLFLCHRIPYPPDKGDKIRSYHMLRYLAHHYDVYLGTFVDDPDDWVHAATVRKYCRDAFFAPLDSTMARVASLRGFFQGEPLSLPYYANSKLARWAKAVSEQHKISRRVVFSSVMGQFLPSAGAEARTLIDFVDVDSDKWAQFALSKRGPMAAVYRREARLLASYEKRLAGGADMSVFVSAEETRFFRSRSSLEEERCSFFNNGVDAGYFDPCAVAVQGAERKLELVFTGAMDYWPNVDAVRWFAGSVLPLLQKDLPELCFTIVGGKPSASVLELQGLKGVTVTGRVPDVRPYLARSIAAVAPMRVARGIQNKVLEAMAMAKPVLVSTMGLEGIDAKDRSQVLIADEPETYRQYLNAILENEYADLGQAARSFVIQRFSWQSSLGLFHQLLEGDSGDS